MCRQEAGKLCQYGMCADCCRSRGLCSVYFHAKRGLPRGKSQASTPKKLRQDLRKRVENLIEKNSGHSEHFRQSLDGCRVPFKTIAVAVLDYMSDRNDDLLQILDAPAVDRLVHLVEDGIPSAVSAWRQPSNDPPKRQAPMLDHES
eukprot:s420_g18.t1